MERLFSIFKSSPKIRVLATECGFPTRNPALRIIPVQVNTHEEAKSIAFCERLNRLE